MVAEPRAGGQQREGRSEAALTQLKGELPFSLTWRRWLKECLYVPEVGFCPVFHLGINDHFSLPLSGNSLHEQIGPSPENLFFPGRHPQQGGQGCRGQTDRQDDGQGRAG